MAGLPKRTKLKSSPEEAAYYRRFHDRGIAALLEGVPRDKLLQEMADQGVPLLSAERLVTAFEQEAALRTEADRVSGRTGTRSTALPIILVWAIVSAILAWTFYQSGQFHWGYLVGAGVLGLLLTGRLLRG